MKVGVIVLITTAVLANLVASVPLPKFRTLHQMCSQNMVCADNLVCRRYSGAAYGTCEKPTPPITAI
ncbi:hypothetical protein DM01DRAFT_1337316 [Hesseltinella vesiculosa]|uniref:CBM1 domain-containing protein n=1 Tax=Hesseltinella vesiculosa TaxID=101127 RepID=A0A1X2GDE0_9FUNG|nr:hypothetical protein DM01DRAFT_1337316 [Hesseltinella vesiculosa]